MSGSDTPAAEEGQEAMDRIERALERIAAMTVGAAPMASGAEMHDIAERLDAIIARLRAALGQEQG